MDIQSILTVVDIWVLVISSYGWSEIRRAQARRTIEGRRRIQATRDNIRWLESELGLTDDGKRDPDALDPRLLQTVRK